MQTTITIEQLEALAAQIETEESNERNRLHRLIAAYARIAVKANPDAFPAMPTEYADEAGHWDNSYPPAQEYRAHSGPRLAEVDDLSWEKLARTSGFYYEFDIAADDPGLFVAPDGRIYGGYMAGTGRYGQFAAYPGNVNVEAEIEWAPLQDVSLEQLARAEEKMRELAFPLVAARLAR